MVKAENHLQVLTPIEHTNPTISVVIPTIPSRTVQTIKYLHDQSIDSFEVLIVVDNYQNDHRCDAKNMGIKKSKADLVALTDDDCAPPVDWLENAILTFRNHPELVLIEGPLDKHNPGPRHYVGANLAVRREAALEIGGFDQRYAGGYREDTEFGWRIENKFGVERCRYLPLWENSHIGPLKSANIDENDALLRREHAYKYFSIIEFDQTSWADVVSSVLAGVYTVSPNAGELLYQLLQVYYKFSDIAPYK